MNKKEFTKEGLEVSLSENAKQFCKFVVVKKYNSSMERYRKAYPDKKKPKSDETCAVMASKLLRKANIQAYIQFLREDIEDTCGVSIVWAINKYKNIAECNLGDMLDDWVTRKSFDELSDEQKEGLGEVIQSFDEEGNEIVKIKLKDGIKAMTEIGKLLDWYAPKKLDITSNGESIKPVVDATTLSESTRKEILKAMQPKED